MFPYRNSRIAVIAFLVLLAVLAGYTYFEARSIIYGPQIIIGEHDRTQVVTERFIILRGSTKNITEIRMNGLPIFVTEGGSFEEPFLLSPGYNTIVFEAKDKLGREAREEIYLVYKPPPEQNRSVSAPTSTPAENSN